MNGWRQAESEASKQMGKDGEKEGGRPTGSIVRRQEGRKGGSERGRQTMMEEDRQRGRFSLFGRHIYDIRMHYSN